MAWWLWLLLGLALLASEVFTPGAFFVFFFGGAVFFAAADYTTGAVDQYISIGTHHYGGQNDPEANDGPHRKLRSHVK